jgi:zinc protease
MTRAGFPPRTLVGGALFVALVLTPAPARADEAPAPQKVVTVEGITEYRYPNGLKLLVFPDPSTPKVTVNMTVLVGSRHEGYGETGMAHLLEHMVFKGTPTHPDVPRALKDHGASFNGTTSYDRTNYFETLNATDENLEFAIRLEADRLVNSFIRREDLASEMTVVRNEFEAGENRPAGILFQRMLAAAYEWHNYGKSTIGNRSDIERVPVENLRAFYKKFYQPDNVVLVVAGNFDEAKALKLVGKYFGTLKKPDRKLDDTYTEEPAQDGERTVVLRRVGGVATVGVVYHIPAAAHEDYAAVEVLANVLSAQPNGKLYTDLVLTKKATSAGAFAFGLHDPGVLIVQAEVDKGVTPEQLRDGLLDILEKAGTEKIDPADVERARTRLLKNTERALDDSNRFGVLLSSYVAQGDWRLFFVQRDRLGKVTAEDVQRVAAKYLTRSNRTVGLYVPIEKPERAAVPATPDVAALVKDVKGSATVAAGEAFDPTVENIAKRTTVGKLGGGVQTALLPKKSRGEQVELRLTLRYGNADTLRGQAAAADLLATLMARGTKKHNRQQLEDELNRLKARLSASEGLGYVTFSVECKRDKLPAALELLGEVLREPTFPADEFDVLKRQARDGLEKQHTDPSSLANRALERVLAPYPKDDVRYEPTFEEEIAQLEALTLDQVKKLYGQLGGGNGELVIVGDFEPATTLPRFEDMLKDWKNGAPYARIERPARTDVMGRHETILTPDKANAVYAAGLSLALSDADPDHPALAVGNFLFGGGSLSSRLGNRVRQKEGLSYGVRSTYSASALDRSARFEMSAIYNPDVKEKLAAVIAEEVNKALKEGIPAAEVEEAKAAYLKQLRERRGSDSALVGLLQNGLVANRPVTWYADYEKKVAVLTAEEVNAAFRKHVDPKRLVIIQAGDFKKGGAQR